MCPTLSERIGKGALSVRPTLTIRKNGFFENIAGSWEVVGSERHGDSIQVLNTILKYSSLGKTPSVSSILLSLSIPSFMCNLLWMYPDPGRLQLMEHPFRRWR
jgi:hypothetical protein